MHVHSWQYCISLGHPLCVFFLPADQAASGHTGLYFLSLEPSLPASLGHFWVLLKVLPFIPPRLFFLLKLLTKDLSTSRQLSGCLELAWQWKALPVLFLRCLLFWVHFVLCLLSVSRGISATIFVYTALPSPPAVYQGDFHVPTASQLRRTLADGSLFRSLYKDYCVIMNLPI